MIADFENARRYFSKSTTIDHRFAPAWVGFGHAFAAQVRVSRAPTPPACAHFAHAHCAHAHLNTLVCRVLLSW